MFYVCLKSNGVLVLQDEVRYVFGNKKIGNKKGPGGASPNMLAIVGLKIMLRYSE